MSLPVVVRPDAEGDIWAIRAELDRVHVQVGAAFRLRLRELLERIEFMPGAYGVVWRDVRAARIKRFQYVVYYIAFADRVEILAVIHGARHASAWKSRV